MGANLEPSVKERLVQLLNEYVEIFAWSYEDMPGLDTDIVVHRLPTREDCPPIKQKGSPNEAWHVWEDQGWGNEAIQRWLSGYYFLSTMGC